MPSVQEIERRLDAIEESASVIRSLALPGARPDVRDQMADLATVIAYEAMHLAESLEPPKERS